jgi:hypothetical protein
MKQLIPAESLLHSHISYLELDKLIVYINVQLLKIKEQNKKYLILISNLVEESLFKDSIFPIKLEEDETKEVSEHLAAEVFLYKFTYENIIIKLEAAGYSIGYDPNELDNENKKVIRIYWNLDFFEEDYKEIPTKILFKAKPIEKIEKIDWETSPPPTKKGTIFQDAELFKLYLEDPDFFKRSLEND